MIVKYNTSRDFRFNICREGDWQAGTCHTDTSTKEITRVEKENDVYVIEAILDVSTKEAPAECYLENNDTANVSFNAEVAVKVNVETNIFEEALDKVLDEGNVDLDFNKYDIAEVKINKITFNSIEYNNYGNKKYTEDDIRACLIEDFSVGTLDFFIEIH